MSEEIRDPDSHRAAMKKLKAEQDAKARSKRIKRGVLIVNTGDGKGKSTAAFGMAIRAAGHGQKVGLIAARRTGRIRGTLVKVDKE